MNEVVTFPVNEIFTSIQGEGCHMGIVSTFVRFAGCNLACDFCDSKETWTEEHATQMTIEEIASQCIASRIVITGGEPTIHPLKELIRAIHLQPWIGRKEARKIAIETNGTRMIDPHWAIDWVTCSPKAPNYDVYCNCHELKYVVTEEFNPNVIAWKAVSKGRIWLQPESHKPESMEKAARLVMQYPEYLRMGIQLHKVLGVR